MAPKSVKSASKSSRAAGKSGTGKSRSAPAKSGRIKLSLLQKKGSPATSRRGAPPASKSKVASPGLSLDRKLDILGIALILVGVLGLLSLASPSDGGLAVFAGMMRQWFGWGMYLLPLGLFAVGLWLVLRNFERVPQVSLERVLGAGLLYANLLILLHFLLLPETRQASFALATEGKGGGYLGAGILETLKAVAGTGGAVIAWLALLLIGLMLALDVPVAELFRWAPALLRRFQDSIHPRPAASAEIPPTPGIPTGLREMSAERPIQPKPVAAPSNAQNFHPSQAMPATSWTLPPIAEILEAGDHVQGDEENDQHRARVIEETLASFGAPSKVVDVKRGPTITQFGVEPDFIDGRGGRMRVRVGKIAALVDDLALALSARTIRIQAPVPGKGYVGIEVPNEQVSLVALRDVIESEAFQRLKSPLRFTLGQDVAGNAVAADLAAMPHLLIAGTTGSGKSVCVNALICCLLLHNTPNELRLLMVDPKRVELSGYNDIPHLLAPVVVQLERVVGALQWVTREMDQRYHKLAQAGTRNIAEYNALLETRGERKLPHLVVVIDELADLMLLAPDETERTLTRLAQLARATGIHLVIATQRPSVDVVTGLIKANFPARIAFAVASGVDSRVILDQPGAERLLGRGDMLFQAPDAAAPLRLQGAFVSDAEIQRLVDYWQRFSPAVHTLTQAITGMDTLPPGLPLKQMPLWEEMEAEENTDPLLNEAIDLARRQGRASVSMLQRRFRIGYTRAARLVEAMEEKGIVGPPQPGTGAREILDYGPAAPPVDEA